MTRSPSAMHHAPNAIDLTHVRILSGTHLVPIPTSVAEAFRHGDRLLALPDGEVLHLPLEQVEIAESAVTRAVEAFHSMARVRSEAVTRFYEKFACILEDDATWTAIEEANQGDVQRARATGRSTTRLEVSPKMRQAMIDGLREWRDLPSPVGQIIGTVKHPGWSVEQVVSPLGVVGFVFEGRPNVFADATGVLRSGNTAVLRIGRDALGTARAIVEKALDPALRESGLPVGSVALIESREHAAGWALFSDSRVALAVARGSGPAVRQLGAIARQAGIPASLHGKGGAWMAADSTADPDRFYQAVYHSLDRKVCNTLNVLCLVREAAPRLVPILLKALRARHETSHSGYRIHVTERAKAFLPVELFDTETTVHRAEGSVREPIASMLAEDGLREEWEWERTPEISLAVAEDLSEAAALVNRYSPHFVVSIISEDDKAQQQFFGATNAPFYGNGFTRWVDGQFALNRPELGLSNWQNGRLLGRSGILSGDGIFTVRLRVRQEDAGLHR